MGGFQIYENMSLVLISDLKLSAELLIAKAQASGALYGTITQARGMVKRSQKLQFRTLSLSPRMESLLLLVPKRHLTSVIHQSILSSGMDRGAMGSVLGVPVKRLWATEYNQTENLDSPTIAQNPTSSNSPMEAQSYKLQRDLFLVTCVCQKGKAEEIAEAAIQNGSASPVIHYGEGKGVRDRMGLLKIAVNPEKEIVHVVTDSFECNRIFDAMVEAGRLYAPGMGFIYTTKIESGFVNLHTTLSTSFTKATREQIIKAIDELKGNKNWRIAEAGLGKSQRSKRKSQDNLTNLKLVTRRGLGDEFIYEAMQNGAHGATRSYARLIGGEQVIAQTGRVINDEREIIDFHVVESTAKDLLSVFEGIVDHYESKNSFVIELEVPRALTYFG